MTKRITLATVKSFIKKNADNLYLSQIESFDGMYDMMTDRCAHPLTQVAIDPTGHPNTLGIQGAWFIKGSNSFEPFSKDGFTGYQVYNCCRHFIIATK